MEPPPNSALGVLAHDVREDDLIECLLIRPARLGDDLVGRARAIKAWQHLLRSPSFFSAVIESPHPLAGHRILGFGAAVFVSRTFAEAEISNPRPGLNGRIIASIDSGRSVVLSERELRSANTRGGLDSVILYGTWREDLLNPDAVSEVLASMASSFVKEHQGYRMNRLLTESAGVGERTLYEASQGWRLIKSFDELPNMSRVLWIVTREDALALRGSILVPLFLHREPVLPLRGSDQRLLLAALDGLTDEGLSFRLGLSLAGVKKRWIAIFERIGDVKPDLFPNCSNNDGWRGKQKRHHLLAYLRSHPEELRPVEPHKGVQSPLRRKRLR